MTTEPEAIPADVMELARAAHANFARSSVKDNLTTIIARSIMADRIRNASPVGWSVRGAEAYRLFTDEAEAREWAGDWGLIKLVYESTPAASPSGGGVVEALKLHIAYEALPTDRGGKNGPKGRAWQAFIAARDAALATYKRSTTDGQS